MVAANTQNCSRPRTIEIGRYNYEKVDSFTYLVSLVTGKSSVSEDARKLGCRNWLVAA